MPPTELLLIKPAPPMPRCPVPRDSCYSRSLATRLSKPPFSHFVSALSRFFPIYSHYFSPFPAFSHLFPLKNVFAANVPGSSRPLARSCQRMQSELFGVQFLSAPKRHICVSRFLQAAVHPSKKRSYTELYGVIRSTIFISAQTTMDCPSSATNTYYQLLTPTTAY